MIRIRGRERALRDDGRDAMTAKRRRVQMGGAVCVCPEDSMG